MTDGNDGGNGIMLSRRDAIRGGAALGTMALASRIGAYAQVVEAQITEPRIQLGSDYAIHDSGGNLVINHDPNGDILEYDPTADQITTLKSLTSVTTGDLDVNLSGADNTYDEILSLPSAGTTDLTDFSRVTTAVSTSAKEIAKLSGGSSRYALFLVQGFEDDGGTLRIFSENVVMNRNMAPSVITDSTLTINSPDARTYSKNNAALEVSMASGSYVVRTRSIEAGGVEQ